MPTRIFGIVNLTEDSFSDGGLYCDPDRALDRARELVSGGAHVIDVGPASSHPDAKPVSPDEEIRRLSAVVAPLMREGVRVSVDSFQPRTQAWALERSVAYLNDIEGFRHAELYPSLARSPCELVLMHSLQRRGRATRTASDPATLFDRVLAFFDERIRALTAAGIARERLILDPGMGFFAGDTPEPSLVLLRRLGDLRRHFGLRVLVSVSRKSFLGALTGRPVAERGAATLAAELSAVSAGADFIRTHDVRALSDALAVTNAL